MIRRRISRISGLLSIIGLAVSMGMLVIILSRSLRLSELMLSIVVTSIGALAGMYSMYLVRFANRLPRLSPRIFLSYSHKDQDIARQVAEAFRTNGARVWLDQERLRPGASIGDEIEKGIADADTFVALLSGTPSPNLLLELVMARAKGITVIPVLLADAEVPVDLQGLQYVDLRKAPGRGLEELVRAAT